MIGVSRTATITLLSVQLAIHVRIFMNLHGWLKLISGWLYYDVNALIVMVYQCDSATV